MADTPSIRIVKSAEYRGGTRSFGNRHHFNGGTPADLSHWTTFANAIVTAEKLATPGRVTFVEAVCYEAGSDIPVQTVSLSGTGSFSGGGTAVAPPLEVCGLIRWETDVRSIKNHPIYLFAYMRATVTDTSLGAEGLSSTLQADLLTYANHWVSGFSDGVNTYTRAGPRGASAIGAFVPGYVRHRDFPK